MRSKVPFHLTDAGTMVINNFSLKLSHQGTKTYLVDFEIKDDGLKQSVQLVTPVSPTKIDIPEKKIFIFYRFDPKILIAGNR